MQKPKKFAGRLLVDAEYPLVIPLLASDIDNASALKSYGVNDPGRFTDCVIAQACERMFGPSASVQINRTTAYVAWEHAENAWRFEHSDGSRALLEAFDRGDPVKPGAQIILNPPSVRRSLKHMREYYHSTEARKRSGQIGRRTPRRQRKSNPIDVTLRNGIFARKAK